MNQDKTILVKKKDGTFARMKISDLKKNDERPVSPTVKVEKEKVVSSQNVWTKEDIKSPLEDEEIKNLKHGSFNKREEEAKEVMEKLSFKLTDQAASNLKNNIILFLKDIKNSEQLSDVLRQPVYLGGADLNNNQIKEVIKIAQDKILSISSEKQEFYGPLKKIPGKKNQLPMPEGEILPSSSSPFNSFVHKPKFNKEIKEIKSLDDLIEKAEPKMENINQLIKANKINSSSPIGDILPPKNVTFGPIEEIKNFTVIDFRRLSSDLEQATSRLQQKFINLKEESFLLYLEALEAWQQSPLYKKYLEAVCESLNKGIPLSGLPKKEDNLSFQEIKSLIKMEKEI
ncbi:MAG TPA: hypothetical protein P5230_03290 [Candidatus Magasanikbacteria bacterium]|nr:hypothetical protein [Candidatus Magasanikbacteria bacterium]